MRLWLSIPLLTLGFLTGCDQVGDKKATQVVAQVNGDEITVHQLNSVLARTPGASQAQAERIKREALERLVNQQLVKQQAIERKLDRTPAVVQAIENAKSDILARAYFEQLAATEPKPTAEEAKQYYTQHPELFAQRRIFHVEEIIVRTEGLARELREQASKSRSMQALAVWLKSKNAQFIQSERIVAAEEVPLGSLRILQGAREGEFQFHEGSDRLSVYRVVSARPAPVDEATATPRIQQFLFSQRVNNAVAKELKRLRETAKIEYLGEFANRSGDKSGGDGPAAMPPVQPELPAAASPPGSDFDKGLRGLK